MNEKNSETLYGVKASYIESYLGNEEAMKIIPRWEKCEKKHNTNFSIAAFFLDEIWYFYKGVYKAGAIFLILMILVPNLLGLAAGTVSMISTADYYAENVTVVGHPDAPQEMGAQAFVRTFNIVYYVSVLILKLICAMFYDYFYFKKVKYCIFYELAGMKDLENEQSVADALSRAKKHRETKEKGLRTGIIIGYIALNVLAAILL